MNSLPILDFIDKDSVALNKRSGRNWFATVPATTESDAKKWQDALKRLVPDQVPSGRRLKSYEWCLESSFRVDGSAYLH